MIEIRIPKEITEYKEKFLFGLTVRQCVSVAAALGIGIPLYIFGKDFLGEDLTSWLVILIVVPIFGFGFIKYNGMTFERLIAVVFRQKFAEPQKRKYEELPVFYEWREEIIENEIARQNERKKYGASRKRELPAARQIQKPISEPSPVANNLQHSELKNSEVEIPVFGGSLFVKYKKNKKSKN